MSSSAFVFAGMGFAGVATAAYFMMKKNKKEEEKKILSEMKDTLIDDEEFVQV